MAQSQLPFCQQQYDETRVNDYSEDAEADKAASQHHCGRKTLGVPVVIALLVATAVTLVCYGTKSTRESALLTAADVQLDSTKPKRVRLSMRRQSKIFIDLSRRKAKGYAQKMRCDVFAGLDGALLGGLPVVGQCVDLKDNKDFFCSVPLPGAAAPAFLPKGCVWKENPDFPSPNTPYPDAENELLQKLYESIAKDEDQTNKQCLDSLKVFTCATMVPACDDDEMVNGAVDEHSGIASAFPCKCLCEQVYANCGHDEETITNECGNYEEEDCQGGGLCSPSTKSPMATKIASIIQQPIVPTSLEYIGKGLCHNGHLSAPPSMDTVAVPHSNQEKMTDVNVCTSACQAYESCIGIAYSFVKTWDNDGHDCKLYTKEFVNSEEDITINDIRFRPSSAGRQGATIVTSTGDATKYDVNCFRNISRAPPVPVFNCTCSNGCQLPCPCRDPSFVPPNACPPIFDGCPTGNFFTGEGTGTYCDTHFRPDKDTCENSWDNAWKEGGHWCGKIPDLKCPSDCKGCYHQVMYGEQVGTLQCLSGDFDGFRIDKQFCDDANGAWCE